MGGCMWGGGGACICNGVVVVVSGCSVDRQPRPIVPTIKTRTRSNNKRSGQRTYLADLAGDGLDDGEGQAPVARLADDLEEVAAQHLEGHADVLPVGAPHLEVLQQLDHVERRWRRRRWRCRCWGVAATAAGAAADGRRRRHRLLLLLQPLSVVGVVGVMYWAVGPGSVVDHEHGTP